MSEFNKNNLIFKNYTLSVFLFILLFVPSTAEAQSAGACSNYANWSAGTYTGGQWVHYSGYVYKACYWTNKRPNTNFNTGNCWANWQRYTCTSASSAPSVSSSNSQSQTSTSGYFNGNVTDDNGATVTSRGFKWGTTSNPTTSVTVGSGNGTYNYNKTGLNSGTTYYYRAWATNSVGTTNGTVKNFTTSALAPTVTTSNAASILSSSATLGGNVTNANGATVTSRGIKWGATSNPTNSITIGSGTGVFTTSLGSLSSGTLYYFRSWATNSAGTTHGTVKSFTTSAAAPTNISLTSTSVNENAGANATVGNLSATDADGGTMNYAITSGGANLNINGSTLRATSSFNYETTTSQSVTIRVTDDGGLTYSKSFTINVTDVNEAPSDITLSNASVAENTGANATVGTLSTTDPEGGAMTYTITAGGTDFNISGSTLRATNTFDYEGTNSYSVTVRVTDGGSLTYDETFTINVSDVNEAPTGITLSNASVAENAGSNATVGSLSGTDPEADAITYTITAGGSDFNLDGTTLRATNSFDYEGTNSYSVTVRVTDGGSLTYDETFTINVSDVNEAPTDITLSNASVAENAGSNATVGTLSGTDPEADAITYTITAGGSDFNLDGTTLRATNSFDYEVTNSYSVTVRVTDGGSLTYDETFTINVSDVNEAPTDISLSNASVAENAGSNATVGTLSTTDPEAGAMTYTITAGGADFNISGSTLRATNSFDYEVTNSYSVTVRVTDGGSLTYDETFTINVTDVNEAPTDITLSNASVAENAGSNATVGTLSGTDPEADAITYTITAGGSDFNLDGTTLRATNSFDYEGTNSYSVTVRVTDGGSLTYDETFTINVSDVNEAPTDITLSNASVAENAGSNATVGTLSGTDPEADAITYTITAGGSDFNLDGTTLRATNSFDYEGTNSYSVTVRVTDGGSLTYDETFTINVSDVNEAPTAISLSNASVAENAGSNATVGTLSGTDPEADAITYTITAGGSNFNLDGTTLRATNSFDYEGTNSYSVTVRCTSTGGLTYDEAFTINVSDVNEAPTDITLSNASVAENAGSNATVGTLSGTDPEADAITYTITAGGSNFNLDGTTLRATNSFDYEVTNSYSVTVRVTDGGSLTYDEAFTINVSDVNEAPTDISLSNASVAENAGSNATVGTLSGTDPEADAITYTITAGGSNFNLDGTTLRATNSFDYEGTNSYSVTVRADFNWWCLPMMRAFTINVSDVNEAPTDISLSNASVAENAGSNATVGTLSGTDPEADAITYTITAGGSNFNLDGTTLRATNSFDYEVTNSYSVTVRATSTGGLTYDEAFTINVSDVNEAPTDISLSNASVAENAGSNATVGTLSGTDPEADAITYTITAGGSNFNLDGTTLRATNSFDYEGTNSYSVTVRATSTGGLTYDEAFTINVSDVNEAPTDISLSNASVAENAGSNATVGTLSGTDPEVDAITYTITAGGSNFNLDGTTLRATNSFDYEVTNSYSVTVRVTDGGSLTYDEAFTINVSDVNEAPTDISLSNASVAENAGSNATVGTLSGTDPEADAITYTITAGGSNFNIEWYNFESH